VPLPPAKKIEPAPAPAVAVREPPNRPAAAAPAEPNRVDKPAPPIATAPPAIATVPAAKVEPAKVPLPPKSQAVLEPPPKPQAAVDPAAACGHDEQRLARLRSDPVPDEVARLQRELSCDKLRPQVQRLFESIATAPLASPAPAGGAPAKAIEPKSAAPTAIAPPAARAEPAKLPPAKSQAAIEPPPKAQAASPPEDPALACSRDEQRLARLRSDPVPEEVARLQRELSCDKLRAQVQRLFESIATMPASVAPVLNPVRKAEPPGEPAAGTRTRAAPVSQENACARDTERLARVRAEPTPDAIARFEKELGCEHIRPQLQRLRESVGQ
jgi:hypothetical protein